MIRVVSGVLLSVLLAGAAHAQGLVRMEIIPFPSVTLTTQQILGGDLNGKPVTLAGQLRIPRAGTDKLPTVLIVHASGGIGAAIESWAREFNSMGLAVMIPDSFSGRGIANTVTDQSQLDNLAMTVDAYRALSVLALHPRIDASRIAIIGFSKGAVAAVYSSNARFQKLLGRPDAEFAAHIGLYTPCNIAFRDDDKLTGKPIRLHHGIADDWVSIEPCRAYASRLKQAGIDATLTEYADAHHSYDVAAIAQVMRFPQAQTTRNCAIKEADNGALLNAKTGTPYSLADSCVERGAHLGYNEAAYKATVVAVKELLVTTFKMQP